MVQMKNIPQAWRTAKPYIESAMSDSLGETADDLYIDLLKDKAQLWTVDGGAAVSRVLQAKKKVLHIVALGGEGMNDWIDALMQEWRSFADTHGCELIMAVGRPGWKKVFPRLGFEVKKITGICEVHRA